MEKCTATITQELYEELIAKKEELRLLKKAIKDCSSYSSELEQIKKIFSIGDQ